MSVILPLQRKLLLSGLASGYGTSGHLCQTINFGSKQTIFNKGSNLLFKIGHP